MPKPMFKMYFTLFLFCLYSCTSHNNSQCVLLATHDADTFSSSFNFREDGTYEWLNGMWSDPVEGRYTLKDSFITLDKIGFDKIIISRHLLVTSVQPNSLQQGKFVIQVDSMNRLVDSIYIFRVYVDARDSASHIVH